MEHLALEQVEDSEGDRRMRFLERISELRIMRIDARATYDHLEVVGMLIPLEKKLKIKAEQILEDSYQRLPE